MIFDQPVTSQWRPGFVGILSKCLVHFQCHCDVAAILNIYRNFWPISEVRVTSQFHRKLFIIFLAATSKIRWKVWSIFDVAATSDIYSNFWSISGVAATSQFCRNLFVIFDQSVTSLRGHSFVETWSKCLVKFWCLYEATLNIYRNFWPISDVAVSSKLDQNFKVNFRRHSVTTKIRLVATSWRLRVPTGKYLHHS